MREKSELSIGKTYNRLTVLRVFSEGGESKAECRCICGDMRVYFLSNVKRGKSTSCGCYLREILKEVVHPKTHGQSNRKKPTSEYWAWGKMKQRCHNPDNPQYQSYGGRGIFVCDTWMHSFEAFYADMGSKPSALHSIDRIDNNDGYYKENCRWTTDEVQMSNRRCVALFPFNGENLCMDAISRRLGFGRSTISKRMSKGWSFEKAISTPIMKSHQRYPKSIPPTSRPDFISGLLG